MPNSSNGTAMEFQVSQPSATTMAWFLPTFVAVFMLVFLAVSFALHHRRFRGRYKRKELLEYYLELHVECGLRRIAAPSTPSSFRTRETRSDETEANSQFHAAVTTRLQEDIDVGENGGQLSKSKQKKIRKAAKVRHQDTPLFRFFLQPTKKSASSKKDRDAPSPETISGRLMAEGNPSPIFKNGLGVNNLLPPMSPSAKRKVQSELHHDSSDCNGNGNAKQGKVD